MQTFLFTFCLMALSIAGLAVGLLFGRGPVKGSCGGLACVEGADCAGCGRKKGCEA